MSRNKVYSYKGVWYDCDLNELVHDNQFINSECITLDNNIDIISLYYSDFSNYTTIVI